MTDVLTAPTPTRTAPEARAESPRRRWSAFALLVAAYFVTIVDFTIVNTALPTIGRSLHIGDADLQWIVTAYGLTYAGFLLLSGRAADLLGRRRLLMAGLVVFTGASLGAGLAGSPIVLDVMRGLQGLGAALVLPAALSTVMRLFPEGAERNKALGIWGGVGALGGTVGLLAGGLFTTYVGWRGIFFFNVPIGVVALALAPKLIPESRVDAARRRYDPFGAASITAALLVGVYGISEAPQVGWTSPRTLAVLAAAVALLAAFVRIESKVEAPLLPLGLLRSRSISGSNIVGFLLGSSFITFVYLGTLYMQQVLHLSPLASGAGWMAASLMSLVFAGISQRVVTRTSARAAMSFGMTLIGAGILWAVRSPAHGSFLVDLLGPFMIAGLGTAFAFIPISIGGLAGVGEKDAGVASGLLNTTQNLGGSLGVAVTSSIAASRTHALSSHGASAAVALTGGLHVAYVVCGACALVAVVVARRVIRPEGS